MLDSLNIENYRNLKDLKINHLGRINLITGKNNTGKSAILEAIAVYASKGDISLIYQLLTERGENYRQIESNMNPTESNINTLSSLFTNRIISFNPEAAIIVGGFDNTLFGDIKSTINSVSIRFVKYFEEVQKDNQGEIIRRKILSDNKSNNQPENYKAGLEIRAGNSLFTLPLEEDKLFKPYRYSFRETGFNENFQFIRTRNIDREINGKLWDKITLSEKEKFVVEALRIIEPSTERIAFIEGSPGERTAVIKLSDMPRVLPLKSLGDGSNRILTIILALVNADNGFLLIDEFENGLHYSIQKQLWKIIFHLASNLNIQVFATSHSEDCITGFESILNDPENTVEGKLIRLDNVNGSIRHIEFDKQHLKIATTQNIEIR